MIPQDVPHQHSLNLRPPQGGPPSSVEDINQWMGSSQASPVYFEDDVKKEVISISEITQTISTDIKDTKKGLQ